MDNIGKLLNTWTVGAVALVLAAILVMSYMHKTKNCNKKVERAQPQRTSSSEFHKPFRAHQPIPYDDFRP